MSFTFNFPNPVDNDQTGVNEQHGAEIQDGGTEHVETFREILPSDIEQVADIPQQSYQLSESVCIQCVDSQAVERRLCDIKGSSCGVTAAAKQHSDLIPNVYEGGLKVWECAVDLAKYLQKCDIKFHNKKVLELGCGAGLPAILAMLNGASCVHFQD
ncbi:uncharacterized protein LOC123532680 [Mercenaria mercenaria]|uniref:uncharacterized protein LOC123532680 n=1 Tax=Mercenaria mercenaria TaxID=6596 RepID=UPI00234F145C|nr:uncharacterized protein LOC123532680 [Mercenaria mercenaria]